MSCLAVLDVALLVIRDVQRHESWFGLDEQKSCHVGVVKHDIEQMILGN